MAFSQINDQKLARMIGESDLLSGHFTGLVIADAASGQVLGAYQEDKYFTPASNTKLLTFYTALRMLGDSVPALQYMVSGDTLFFRGTGDPSLLHTFLDSHRVLDFLRNEPKHVLYFSEPPSQNPPPGPRWAWGAFFYAFQLERSV